MVSPHKAIGTNHTTHNSKCLAKEILGTQPSTKSMIASPPHAPGGSLLWDSVEGFYFIISVEIRVEPVTGCVCSHRQFVILDCDISSFLKIKTAWPLLCFSIFTGPSCLSLAVVTMAQSLCRDWGWLACFWAGSLFPVCCGSSLPWQGEAYLTGENPTILNFHCSCSASEENSHKSQRHL